MIKGFILAVLLLVLLDLGVFHGEHVKRFGASAGSFAHFVAHMGDGSLFAA